MFFQEADPSTGDSSKGLGKALEQDIAKNKDALKNAQEALQTFSTDILKTFTQGRERIFELQRSLVDALPNIRRLGGGLDDVSKIISGVAEASRRNVVATTEQIEKLYAAEKVIGIAGGTLAESFLNVGIGIESIPNALEESIQYVQSIGGNAKTVMKDVTDNMGQMNRYQFEGGVQGLTKMAAQASMLRFDMKETFTLAERVLDPDGAIEVAGAFQRLGVAAGTLVDPFALMNASINDPSGLQDSLINVAKQFTYFDDETKSFKINRQGVLTLREIENEEDKQYLANIGSMTKGGQYEVKFRDEKGTEQMRKLSEITQDEFNLLIKQQKDSSKPIEETAREQLTLQKSTDNNIAAIRSLMMGVTLTSDVAMDVTEGLKQVADATARGAERTTNIEELRKTANDASGDLRDDLIEAIKGGKTSEAEIFTILAEGAVNIFGEVGKESMTQIGKASREISRELEDEKNTYTAKALSDSIGPILDGLSVLLTGDKAPTSDIPSGFGFSSSETAFPTGARTTGVTVGGIDPITPRGVSLPLPSREPIKVEFGPVPPIDLNFNGGPQNMTPQQIEEITKIFERLIQRQYIKNYLVDNTNESSPFQRGTSLGL
jgi:hypothetical protein